MLFPCLWFLKCLQASCSPFLPFSLPLSVLLSFQDQTQGLSPPWRFFHLSPNTLVDFLNSFYNLSHHHTYVCCCSLMILWLLLASLTWFQAVWYQRLCLCIFMPLYPLIEGRMMSTHYNLEKFTSVIYRAVMGYSANISSYFWEDRMCLIY